MVMKCEYNYSDNNAKGINLEFRDVQGAVLIGQLNEQSFL